MKSLQHSRLTSTCPQKFFTARIVRMGVAQVYMREQATPEGGVPGAELSQAHQPGQWPA